MAAAQVLQVVAQHIREDAFLAVLDRRLDGAEERETAGEDFKAALVAAPALGSVHVDDHVTQLPRRVVHAAVEFSIDDDAAADAGADEDAEGVARFGFELHLIDTEHAGLAVVLQEDRHIQPLLQFLDQGHVLPAQVGREDDFPVLRVHRPRGADADGPDLLEGEVAFVDGVDHTTRNPLDDGLRSALGFGAELGGAERLQPEVKNPGENLGAAEIDAEDVGAVVIGHASRGVTAHARGMVWVQRKELLGRPWALSRHKTAAKQKVATGPNHFASATK